MTTTSIINREHWLTELVSRLEPIIASHGHKLPKYRISCSFPVSRARPKAGSYHIGECWPAENSVDGHREIFISPVLDDPIKIADVTLHEMCHAVLAPGVGHKAPFARLAAACGLEGKPTATEASDSLAKDLKAITDELGPYPHSALDATSGKKQTTRLLKSMCPFCGYVARVTSKWIDEVGQPLCPNCAVPFVDPSDEDLQENPLEIDEQSVEYKFKGTTQYVVRMIKRSKCTRWTVLDYGAELGHFEDAAYPRVVAAESREDAVNLVESLKEGLLTHEELEAEETEDETLDPEAPDDTADDWAKDFYEEEETADYEDGILNDEELALYEANKTRREELVA